MVRQKLIAIIPARGGSKRIPRKNIVDFYGVPMIALTIQAALRANYFHRVLVSTDDPEIADIAIKFGAEAPFLRSNYYDDTSSVSMATLSALFQAESYWSETYDIVVQLMPNCPLRDEHDIIDSINNFLKHEHFSQISCFRFGFMNPWWAVTIEVDGSPSYLFPDKISLLSQECQPLYCPSGAIWIAISKKLKQFGTFYMPEHKFFPLNWISAIDIDNEDDLLLAKVCYMIKGNNKVN